MWAARWVGTAKDRPSAGDGGEDTEPRKAAAEAEAEADAKVQAAAAERRKAEVQKLQSAASGGGAGPGVKGTGSSLPSGIQQPDRGTQQLAPVLKNDGQINHNGGGHN